MSSNPFTINEYSNGKSVKRAVIALHGFTGNEHSMKPVAIGSRLKDTKWYFPRAPYSLEKDNQYSWFSGSKELGWNCARSFELLSMVINTAASENSLSFEDIFLVGFSQGACMAVEAGLRCKRTLGGIISIAGFIRHFEDLEMEISESAKETPVLLMHGRNDKIVELSASEKSLGFLNGLGVKTDLVIFEAHHKIPITAYPDLRKFILGEPGA